MSKMMKAALIHQFDGIEKVTIEEISIPLPKDDEVQIRIKYAAINPVDWKIAEGLLKTRMSYEFPIILGWDLSGFITSVGKNVKSFKEGDAIFAYARKEIMHDGAFAEFICLNENNIALKPRNLNFAEAAAVPLSALTAWQSLYETAHMKSRETVLVQAGAGSVGGFAIQLAKLKDAYIFTTASGENFDYVKSLGAQEVIDYTKENFVSVIQKKYPNGLDLVVDAVGDEVLKQSYEVVKKKGVLVSIVGMIDQALAAQRKIRAAFVFVRPDGEQLKKIAELFDEAKLKAPRILELPFEDVVLGLRKSRERHSLGKLVLKITP